MRRRIWLGILLALPIGFGSSVTAEVREEGIHTSDGIRLSAKRYEREGSQPVVLFHGLASNIFSLDLDEPDSSLARYLFEDGFDVWCVNLRGHGDGVFQSEDDGTWTRTVDHFATLDVDAAVLAVFDRTGIRPLVGGHSMGGMVLYMWLQGTRFVIDSRGRLRVVGDPALAESRNHALIAGVFTVASPPAVRWPADANLLNWWLHDYWDYNFLVTALAQSSLVASILGDIDVIPQGAILDFFTDDLRDLPFFGDHLSDFLLWTVSHVADNFLFSMIFDPRNMTPEQIETALDTAIDDVAATVAAQFLDWVRAETVRESVVDDPFWPPYSYSDHLDRVTAPILTLAGDHDKLANDDVIYSEGYLRFGSEDKTFHLIEGHGHGDIILGNRASDLVYPLISEFLRLHSDASPTIGIR